MADRQRQKEIADELFAVCDDGDGAVFDAEGPLSRLYAHAVDRGLGWAGAARAAIGVWGQHNAFLVVRERAASVSAGNAGWSAEVDGKRMPRACAEALEDDEFLYHLRLLVREPEDAGEESADAEELAALAEKAFAAREKALALLAEIG